MPASSRHPEHHHTPGTLLASPLARNNSAFSTEKAGNLGKVVAMDSELRVSRRTALLAGAAGALSGLVLEPPFGDATGVLAAPADRHPDQAINKSAIEHALGKVGQMQSDGVLQFSLDRQDVQPMVEGIKVAGSFFLGVEAFFKQYGSQTMAMVEIPVPGNEVNPTIQRVFAEGMTLMALHNHRIRMSPQIWWIHLMGMGNGPALAAGIRRIIPQQGRVFASGAMQKHSTPLKAQMIGTILGGQMLIGDGGVVEVTVDRTDTVMMNGVQVPSSFGTNHDIYFEPLGGDRAALAAELALV